MAATHNTNCTASCAPVLYLALDLGASNWKLAFTVGLGQKPRLKTITARSTLSLVLEIKAAKRRFGLPEDAPVLCCYEAGRDGFWLHRFLLAHGGKNWTWPESQDWPTLLSAAVTGWPDSRAFAPSFQAAAYTRLSSGR